MAFSAARITRLGLACIPRGLYGSFAGKEAAAESSRQTGGFVVNVGRGMIR